MRGSVLLGVLLVLVGLVSAPLFKETIGRLLLFAIFGGILLFSVVCVVGGFVLIVLRSAG